MKAGSYVIVTDTVKNHVHGFMPDEVAIIKEWSLSAGGLYAVLCESTERKHTGILFKSEVSIV